MRKRFWSHRGRFYLRGNGWAFSLTLSRSLRRNARKEGTPSYFGRCSIRHVFWVDPGRWGAAYITNAWMPCLMISIVRSGPSRGLPEFLEVLG